MVYNATQPKGKQMKKMIVAMAVLSLLTLAAVSFAQCCGAAKATAAVSAALCPKCGEVAGSEKCCAEGAEACAGCGLHKGSPGCVAKCAAPAEVPAAPAEVPAAPAEAVPVS